MESHSPSARLKLEVSVLAIIGIALLALTSYWLGFRSGRQFPRPVDVVRKNQTQPKTRTAAQAGGTAARVPASPETPASPAEALSQACQTGWRELAAANPVELEYRLTSRQLLLSRDCLQRMSEDVHIAPVQRFVTFCQLEVDRRNGAELQDVCVPLLAQLRAWVVRVVDAPDLAAKLRAGFLDPNTASLEDLNRNIDIADQLIAQDPNSYAAYKAKFLSLLMKELKFGEPVDDDQYQQLYDELLSFSAPAAQVGTEAAGGTAAELAGIDRDLIHIPFLRLAALGQYDELAAIAEDYIEAYPQSYVGYQYLAEAAWRSGDQAAAVSIYKNVLGDNVSDAAAAEALERMMAQNPLGVLAGMKPE